MSDGNVLESDVLRLQSFSGTEGISQPFEFKLDIRANDYTFFDSAVNWPDIEPEDGQPRLDMDALLGASITVMIGFTETDEEALGHYPVNRRVSSFNGIIYDVAMLDRGVWNITMKPRIALLGLQSSYRMFEDKTILDVIELVLFNNGISFTSHALVNGGIDLDAKTPVVTGLGTFRKQSWLQAGETDLDFLNRLMGKAGIFFYFVHSLSDHILVLTDQSYYQLLFEREEEGVDDELEVKKLYLTSPTLGVNFEDGISQFSFQRSLAVKGVSTILARKQAAWESADAADVAPVYRDDRLAQPTLSMEKMHIVSYGAGETELDIRKERLEKQLLSAKSSLSGSSGYPGLQSGFVFELAEAREVWDLEEDTLKHGNHRSGRSRRSLIKMLRRLRLRKLKLGKAQKKKEEPLTLQDAGAMRPELAGAQMVAVSVTHDAKIDGAYSNQFTAFDRYGYGKAFDAAGDQDGTIIAQVCDSSSNSKRSATTAGGAITKFLKAKFVSKYFLDKASFVDRHNKLFTTTDASTPNYNATGVYVQFVNSNVDSDPVWVRLSESMTTIPERGAFVLVSRARDDTEVPEVQQVVDSVGSKTIMPQSYTKNTSLGDSYSTRYGDSHSISVPLKPSTTYETFTSIVENKPAGLFTDVSFSENSSYSFSFSPKSFSRSVSGKLPEGKKLSDIFSLPTLTDKNIQVSQSVIYGDNYSDTVQTGNQASTTTTNGNTDSTTTQTGNQTTTSTTNGNTVSTTTQNGNQTSTSTTNGNTDSTTTQNGTTNSTTTQSGHQHSETTQTGGSFSITTQSDHQHAETKIHGSSLTINEQVGLADTRSVNDYTNSASVVGSSTAESVVGSNASVSVTGASNTVSRTGLSDSVSTTGISNTAEVTGLVNSISITGLDAYSLKVVGEQTDMKWPGGEWSNHEEPKIEQTVFEVNMIVAIKIEM
jgi:type VI secretion system secreted protein VgrG